MHLGKFNNIDALWAHTLQYLLTEGNVVNSRVGKTQECIGFTAELRNINNSFLLNERRKLSATYACAEFLWYLSDDPHVDMICAYAPSYSRFADDGIAYGAYGYRSRSNLWKRDASDFSDGRSQLDLVIEHLRDQPDSRQAVITFWEANDLAHACKRDRKDLPCTLALQFFIRDGRLNLIVTMRSNDAWLGLPYDIFAFTCIQQLVAAAVEMPCGSYIHQAGSEHLYEQHWVAAREAIDYIQSLMSATVKGHDWRNRTKNVQAVIAEALKLESRFRNKEIQQHHQTDRMTPLTQIPVLYDATVCCAYKFNYFKGTPTSPALRRALSWSL